MVMARYIILFHLEFGNKVHLSDYVLLLQKQVQLSYSVDLRTAAAVYML